MVVVKLHSKDYTPQFVNRLGTITEYNGVHHLIRAIAREKELIVSLNDGVVTYYPEDYPIEIDYYYSSAGLSLYSNKKKYPKPKIELVW